MAISYIDKGERAHSGGAISIPPPTVYSEGNLLLLHITIDGDGTFTTPSGWTAVAASPPRSNNDGLDPSVAHQVYWKEAAASEAAVIYTDSGEQNHGTMTSWGGVDMTSPIESYTTDTEATATSPHTVSGPTTSESDCMLVYSCSIGDNVVMTTFANATLDSVTDLATDQSNIGDDSSTTVAYGIFSSTGDSGDLTFASGTNQESACIAIALKPDTGGGGTAKPYGQQKLDNQYSAIAASRLGGVLQ